MKLCECGCGKEIISKKHHSYYGIPKFIRGHYSKSEKGRKGLVEVNIGHVPWNKGLTKENDERIIRLSEFNTGTHRSEKSKEKMRISAKNRKSPAGFLKGHSVLQDTKDKISETIKRSGLKRGKNNPAWKGGVTSLKMKIRHLPEYKQWRSDVFQRDNWTCQTCGKRGCYLEAHHSGKSFIQIIEENQIMDIWEAQLCNELWDIDKGVTLCKICHKLTDNYLIKGRKVWAKT